MTPQEVEWQEHSGKRVTVRAVPGSWPAKAAPQELADAESVVAALELLLKPDDAGRVDIYLIDPVTEPPPGLSAPEGVGEGPAETSTIGANGIMRVLRSEGTPDPIARPLTRLLIGRWFGPAAASADPFVEGIAGVIAARTATGTDLAEVEEWVRGEIAAGRPVSVLAGGQSARSAAAGPGGRRGMPEPGAGSFDEPDEDDSEEPPEGFGPPGGSPPGGAGSGSPGSPDGTSRAATSFVAYLMTAHGDDSLKKFLAAFEPQRRDDAAVTVFQNPTGGLEEAWLARFSRRPREQSLLAQIRFLFPLMKPHMSHYLEIIGLMVISVGVGLVLPLVSGCVVDGLARRGLPPGTAPEPGGLCGTIAPELTKSRLLMIVVVLILAYLLDSAISLRRAYASTSMFKKIAMSLQERMFTRLQYLSHRFYGEAKVGDLMSRLSSDLEGLEGAMVQVFGTGVMMAMTSTAAAVTSLLKSPQVGAIVLLLIPAFLLTNKILGSKMAQAGYELQEKTGDVLQVSQENLSAHSVIKAFGLEDRSIGAYSNRLGGLLRSHLRMTMLGQLFGSAINIATTLSQVIILGVGSLLVINQTIDNPGTMVTLLLLLPSVFIPVTALTEVGQAVQMASGSIARANEIFEKPIEIADKLDAAELPPLSEEIRFEHVKFGYDPGRTILHDLNMLIPAGSSAAIVGPSGSGKSTIVNLLMRFYDPDEGRVVIDDHDLRAVKLSSLRGQIGIVFQDTFIFNTTLRDNIGIGLPSASDAEIEAAAEAAQLGEHIASLPSGFDTVLGERGVRMSGGQRQRLAIARALLRDPRILILDEATSALDARTEAEILDVLAGVTRSRTTVTITHRLSMAASADRIFVLEQGRLAEQGTHDELVSAGGLYQKLYEEQTSHVAKGRPRVGIEAARLKTVPLFAEVDPTALADLAERLVFERFALGEDVVRQGEQGDKLYFLSRGDAEVLVNDGQVERQVNTLNEGDYFGEYALLTGEERSATVRATSPLEVYSLAQKDLAGLVETQANLRASLTQIVAERSAAYEAAATAAGIELESV